MLYYKNYAGSIEWSDDRKVFYGCVLNIEDSVIYQSDNILQLKKEFEKAVDDYLEALQKLLAP